MDGTKYKVNFLELYMKVIKFIYFSLSIHFKLHVQ